MPRTATNHRNGRPSMSMLRNLPFSGTYPLSLGFGEEPQLFRRLIFKGVPVNGHPGLDFELPLGTSVLAVQHGVVLDVRNDPDGYGQSVLLGHRWGQTFYAHLNEVRVEKGQQAAAGQPILSRTTTARVAIQALPKALRSTLAYALYPIVSMTAGVVSPIRRPIWRA